MKYSTPSNQSNNYEHCNKTQPYMRYDEPSAYSYML